MWPPSYFTSPREPAHQERPTGPERLGVHASAQYSSREVGLPVRCVYRMASWFGGMGSDVQNSKLTIGQFTDDGQRSHVNFEFGTSEPLRTNRGSS
jgi:hypothetical protein